MKRILVTGANSFVGTNFQKYSQYRHVKEFSLIGNRPEDIDYSKYDIILHLAAIVHQSKKIDDVKYYKVNRDLTLRIAELAKKSGVKHFIFLSTIKVYGDFVEGMQPWNETSECNPYDGYGKSKYAAELTLQKIEDKEFTVSIIRTPLVYGEGVKANMLSIIKFVDKLPLLPFRKVNNRRHFTYIENLVGFIDRMIEKKASGVFLAMDEHPLSTTGLVNIISKQLGKKRLLFSVPMPLINLGKKLVPKIFDRLYGSFELENNKTLKTLDYKPCFSPEEGIGKMVEAYQRSKEGK